MPPDFVRWVTNISAETCEIFVRGVTIYGEINPEIFVTPLTNISQILVKNLLITALYLKYL